MNNYLILRSQNSPYNDVTKSSVLSFADMDNNLLFLKGHVIYTAITEGSNVILKKYNGEDITFAGGGGGSGSGDSYWTSGSTGNYSIKTINDSTTNATGNYAVAEGYNTTASGNYSTASGYESIAGWKGFTIDSVVDGLITLNTSYGDVTGEFTGSAVILDTKIYYYITVTFSSTTNTQILLDDTTAIGYNYVADLNNLNSQYADNYVGNSAHAEGIGAYALGNQAHAEGFYTYATGVNSHAEGYGTRAGGFNAHAEGTETIASGFNAHAEGTETIASGENSHTEGQDTEAIGDESHAEGKGTRAIGIVSHAEGSYTIASGEGSHAEGTETKASGDYSHSEGYYTIASGEGSHAEGGWNDNGEILSGGTALGKASHAEGQETIAGWKGFSIDSTVSGVTTLNSSYGDVTSEFTGNKVILDNEIYNFSIVTFSSTTNTEIILIDITVNGGTYVADLDNLNSQYADTLDVFGRSAHAEGNNTKSLGVDSHAEGYRTIATGAYGSHAEGDSTIASAWSSHAEGERTTASGTRSHAEGELTTAIGSRSHAEGYLTVAQGNQSHAEGQGTRSLSNASHAEGAYTTAIGQNSHAEGQYTITGWRGFTVDSVVNGLVTINLSYGDITSEFTGNKVILDGRICIYNTVTFSSTTNTEILLNDLTINGGYLISDIDNLNSALADNTIGVNGHVEGFESKALGENSPHAEGIGTIASGNYSSHAEGGLTIASGNYSHAEGYGTIASGNSSHAEGQGNIASGPFSHAEGNNTAASGYYSHAQGNGTIAIGDSSHAEGWSTKAIGWYSHAGGNNSIASGDTSFIHSSNSLVTGERSAVLGGIGITGATNDTVYVPYFNIQSATTNNALTEILVIDTSGNVKKRDVSTISGDGTFSGGTVTGSTSFTNGLTANTISATTYFNLPIDIFTTGGTYSNGTTTFTNNTGGTFNVTGYFKTSDDIYTTGMTFNASNYNLTITRNDNTSFTQSLSILASDLTVTGGTYNPNTGIGTFTNNTGGTFTVSGFLTGMTDTYTTGFTYSNNNLTIKQNQGKPDLTVLIDTMSGLTVNGLLSATTISGNTVYGNDFPQLPYTDNETVEVYSASGDTFLRVKDVVSAPSGGTRTFNGNINVTSGLTINGNLTYTGQTNNPVYTAGTVTATHIPNWNNSNIQDVILSAATTNISGGTNIANGAVYTMILKQNASGSRTVNWDTQYKWKSGIAPVLTSTANAVDILTFISDGTNLYGLIEKDFR